MKYLLILLLLSSCGKQLYISKDDFNSIPKGSRFVIASVNYPADSLFKVVSQIMARDSWPITIEKTAMQISSNGRSIGNGTYMIPNVFIESTSSGSAARFSGEWKLDQQGQIVMQAFTNSTNYSTTRIVFGKTGTSKGDAAFQKLVRLGQMIQGSSLSYDK